MFQKRIAILGSTGSIGESTIKIVRHLKDKIKISAIAAHSNIEKLEAQALEFSPELIGVYDKEKARILQKKIPHIKVLGGLEGIEAVASWHNADMAISAMTGTLGLVPTLTAINAGKDVGLANKEALISGGALVTSLVKAKGVKLIPIDSEHSAIFQCLNGENPKTVKRIILTASGGPFRTFSREKLANITVDNALAHPTWKMGPKVTVDSSTLMNKGLEVIEAYWLFNIPLENINVVIHPQSIIHSMVEFIDSSMLAQMGEPNMMVPIQYALTYPERLPGVFQNFDFIKNHTLQFFAPDYDVFRCLKLAFDAARQGGSMMCYMNAANEILVHRFLQKQISWVDIGKKLEELMTKHSVINVTSLDEVLHIDQLAREQAAKI